MTLTWGQFFLGMCGLVAFVLAIIVYGLREDAKDTGISTKQRFLTALRERDEGDEYADRPQK